MSNNTKIKNAIKVFNPFPGLRPFSIDESYLFFGREGQSDEVLHKLAVNRFVAVIGASGSGKSSLIYCGVIPILNGGYITKTGANWKIIVTRPGSAPIENLAESLAKAEHNSTEEELYLKKQFNAAVLSSSSKGLIDAIDLSGFVNENNILILVDQFEELFRYKTRRTDSSTFNEALAFVKLLIEAVNYDKIPIYIAITMRSDFIGECAQYQDLTKLINESHYLIPQMTRTDFHDAIVGPIAVGGGNISQRLLLTLLNEISDNPDQLPILQHALMRTWDYWIKFHKENEPLDIEHYEAIGRMEKALSDHANEAYDELNEEEKTICKNLFKTITEKGADNRGIRRPTSIKDINAITKGDLAQVIKVIDQFRQKGRSFITASTSAKIDSDTIIDISHESLMRIWDRLKNWVDEEYFSVQMYLRLSESSALYQEGKTGLWRPPDLQIAINWRNNEQPTLAWAERYDTAFERTMVYLKTSEKEFLAEEENKIRLQKKALRRSQIFAVVLGVAAIISLGFMLYSVTLQVEADRQRKMAEEQKIIAEAQKTRAERESQEADKQKTIALEKEKEAVKQKNEAEKQKSIAEYQTKIALHNAQEALLQKEIANRKSIEANEQRDLAEKKSIEATEQRQNAENAKDLALKLRMLSIAQSMAVKSLQINDDPDKKGLIAYQAFLFNDKFGGNKHNADIYSGLYYALKSFKDGIKNKTRLDRDAIKSIVCDTKQNIYYATGSNGKIYALKPSGNFDFSSNVLFENGKSNKQLAISSNGKYLACISEGADILLFNTSNFTEPPQILKKHNKNVHSIFFSKNSDFLLSTAADSNIVAWNLKENTASILLKSNYQIKSIKQSPNEKLLAGITDNGKLIIWNLENLNPIIIYDNPDLPLMSLAFSNDNKKIVAGDIQGSIMIWETETNNLLNVLIGHTARIIDIKFSPNDKFLSSGSFDGSILIWETANYNNQPLVLKDHNSWVWSLEYSENSEYLLAGCGNGQIVNWPTNLNSFTKNFCTNLLRNMTQQEWEIYVAKDINYAKTCDNLD